MKKNKRKRVVLSIAVNLLFILILISPFIPIKDSFKSSYVDLDKTIILIEHFWNDNTNILLSANDEVLDYINGVKEVDYTKIDNNAYQQVSLINNNPFTYVSQSIYSEEKGAFFVLSGNFNSNGEFYVDDWYGWGSKTLLGETKFYQGNGIMNIIYYPCLVLFIPSLILTIVLFVRTCSKTR